MASSGPSYQATVPQLSPEHAVQDTCHRYPAKHFGSTLIALGYRYGREVRLTTDQRCGLHRMGITRPLEIEA
jgi:hypothetical protein